MFPKEHESKEYKTCKIAQILGEKTPTIIIVPVWNTRAKDQIQRRKKKTRKMKKRKKKGEDKKEKGE